MSGAWHDAVPSCLIPLYYFGARAPPFLRLITFAIFFFDWCRVLYEQGRSYLDVKQATALDESVETFFTPSAIQFC